MIEISHLYKTYEEKQQSVQVLKDVNLVINELDSVAIVGLSGAGKSTLIRIINGLVKKTSGTVIIDGKSIDDLKGKELNELKHQMGMVFQHFNLLSQATVFQNVKYALEFVKYPKDKIKDRVLEVLKQVGLESKVNNYPATLSGGEKQRVGIARAIVNNPKYLLLDEITSALDSKTSREIINLLLDLKKKYSCTIIFISHQLEIAKELCSRFIFIEHGTIEVDLPTLDLFTNTNNAKTRQLVESVINSNTTETDDVYRLIFVDDVSTTPLVSELSKKYPDDYINILFGRKVFIYGHQLGYLDILIQGSHQKEIVEYIESLKIRVEKL